jgi:murein DD-endopeptidase MepM/ murein hydrolase activator NlpD
MRKKISFFVLSNTGSPTKRVTFSRSILWGLGGFLAVGCLFFGYIVFDYCGLKRANFYKHQLENKIANQQEEISIQRKQIQNFAGEINTLKTELISLNSFEKKIRIIANIEKSPDQLGLFGVGGSIPDDLDANIQLTEKHNSLLREMHTQIDQMDVAIANQKEGFDSLLKYLNVQRNLLASTPAIRPLNTNGWVTSNFGYRQSPFTGRREFHKGLDIATRKGEPIVATANGTVTYSGMKGGLGNVVVVDHGHGMVTRYGHSQKLLKKRGEKVKRGDIIALVGNTGRSTGPHVHYEVHLNGIPVNPEKYILN